MTSNMERLLEHYVKDTVGIMGVGYGTRVYIEKVHGEAGLDMYYSLGYHNREEKEARNA